MISGVLMSSVSFFRVPGRPRAVSIAVIAVSVLLGWSPHPVYGQHHSSSGLPHNIPDFCATPTIRSVANGLWSSPSTWSLGRVPAAGDVVAVAAGHSVTYDVVSDASLRCLSAVGQLTFRTNANTRVKTAMLMVMAGGQVTIGQSGAPVQPAYRAEVIIANVPLDTATDPEQ